MTSRHYVETRHVFGTAVEMRLKSLGFMTLWHY